MTLTELKNLLSNKNLDDYFFEISSLLAMRISGKEIKSFQISENIYAADHFLDICTSRLDYIEKKGLSKPPGLKETRIILESLDVPVRSGYVISKNKEKFSIYFQKDLKRIIALHYTNHIDPVILKGL